METTQKSSDPKTETNGQIRNGKKWKFWMYLLVVVGMIILFGMTFIIGRWASTFFDDDSGSDTTSSDQNVTTKSDLSEDPSDVSEDIGNTYENTTFGFNIEFPSSWSQYKAEETETGGDFDIGTVQFYLPTSEEAGFADDPGYLPGYINLFTISVYVKDSWDDPARDHSTDEFYGEEIARNDQYVFIYSHFNGEAPSDIAQNAIIDMATISDSIQVK